MPAIGAFGFGIGRPRATSSWILRLCIVSLASVLFFVRYSSSSIAVSSPKHSKIQGNHDPNNIEDTALLKNLAASLEDFSDPDAFEPALSSIPPQRNASRVLLVSALFPLSNSKSKHTIEDYTSWLTHFSSFRAKHPYTLWPDPWTVDRVWKSATLFNEKEEDLLFFPIFGPPPSEVGRWKEDMGPVDYEISEGSFFGGPPQSISWWCRTYYPYHSHYLSRSLFVGKDQTLINALLLLFPSRFFTVYSADPQAPQRDWLTYIPFHDRGYLGACGSSNGWYYHQYFLASHEERRKQGEVWFKEEAARWPWRWLDATGMWWRRERECRLLGGENWED
ncbi:hypothetical protein CPB84DRAFT_1850533 [Gymnopilus junonius]|uniref:Uncharacterized protein n=1 Tax=Gymnopilus junonius TaxID=109634 RepID=A0A9P5NE31_GYMJU|nr:hypothetical protein CPB84DRAFT_1850533 [Gymnopilus junonius]